MKTTRSRRLWSAFLALVMLLSLLPASALAAEAEGAGDNSGELRTVVEEETVVLPADEEGVGTADTAAAGETDTSEPESEAAGEDEAEAQTGDAELTPLDEEDGLALDGAGNIYTGEQTIYIKTVGESLTFNCTAGNYHYTVDGETGTVYLNDCHWVTVESTTYGKVQLYGLRSTFTFSGITNIIADNPESTIKAIKVENGGSITRLLPSGTYETISGGTVAYNCSQSTLWLVDGSGTFIGGTEEHQRTVRVKTGESPLARVVVQAGRNDKITINASEKTATASTSPTTYIMTVGNTTCKANEGATLNFSDSNNIYLAKGTVSLAEGQEIKISRGQSLGTIKNPSGSGLNVNVSADGIVNAIGAGKVSIDGTEYTTTGNSTFKLTENKTILTAGAVKLSNNQAIRAGGGDDQYKVTNSTGSDITVSVNGSDSIVTVPTAGGSVTIGTVTYKLSSESGFTEEHKLKITESGVQLEGGIVELSNGQSITAVEKLITNKSSNTIKVYGGGFVSMKNSGQVTVGETTYTAANDSTQLNVNDDVAGLEKGALTLSPGQKITLGKGATTVENTGTQSVTASADNMTVTIPAGGSATIGGTKIENTNNSALTVTIGAEALTLSASKVKINDVEYTDGSEAAFSVSGTDIATLTAGTVKIGKGGQVYVGEILVKNNTDLAVTVATDGITIPKKGSADIGAATIGSELREVSASINSEKNLEILVPVTVGNVDYGGSAYDYVTVNPKTGNVIAMTSGVTYPEGTEFTLKSGESITLGNYEYTNTSTGDDGKIVTIVTQTQGSNPKVVLSQPETKVKVALKKDTDTYTEYSAVNADTKFVMTAGKADTTKVTLLSNGSKTANSSIQIGAGVSVTVTDGNKSIATDSSKNAATNIGLNVSGSVRLEYGYGTAEGEMTALINGEEKTFTADKGSKTIVCIADDDMLLLDTVEGQSVTDENNVTYEEKGAFKFVSASIVAASENSTVTSKDGKRSITGGDGGAIITIGTDGSITLIGGRGKTTGTMTAQSGDVITQTFVGNNEYTVTVDNEVGEEDLQLNMNGTVTMGKVTFTSDDAKKNITIFYDEDSVLNAIIPEGVSVTGNGSTIAGAGTGQDLALVEINETTGALILAGGTGSSTGTMTAAIGTGKTFVLSEGKDAYTVDVDSKSLSVPQGVTVTDQDTGVKYKNESTNDNAGFGFDSYSVVVDEDATIVSKDGTSEITGVAENDLHEKTKVLVNQTTGALTLYEGSGKTSGKVVATIRIGGTTDVGDVTFDGNGETAYTVDTSGSLTLPKEGSVTVGSGDGAVTFTASDDMTSFTFLGRDSVSKTLTVKVITGESSEGSVANSEGTISVTSRSYASVEINETTGALKLVDGTGRTTGTMKAKLGDTVKTFTGENKYAVEVDAEGGKLILDAAGKGVVVTDETGAEFEGGKFTFGGEDGLIEVAENATIRGKSDGTSVTGVAGGTRVSVNADGNVTLELGSGKSEGKINAKIVGDVGLRSFESNGKSYTVDTNNRTLTLNAAGASVVMGSGDSAITFAGGSGDSFTLAKADSTLTATVSGGASITGNGVTITGVKDNTATKVEIDETTGALTLVEGKGKIENGTTVTVKYPDGKTVEVSVEGWLLSQFTIDTTVTPAEVKELVKGESVTIKSGIFGLGGKITFTVTGDGTSDFPVDASYLNNVGDQAEVDAGLAANIKVNKEHSNSAVQIPSTNKGKTTVTKTTDGGTVKLEKAGDTFTVLNTTYTAGTDGAVFTLNLDNASSGNYYFVSVTEGSAKLNKGDSIMAKGLNVENNGDPVVTVTAPATETGNYTVTIPAGGCVGIGSGGSSTGIKNPGTTKAIEVEIGDDTVIAEQFPVQVNDDIYGDGVNDGENAKVIIDPRSYRVTEVTKDVVLDENFSLELQSNESVTIGSYVYKAPEGSEGNVTIKGRGVGKNPAVVIKNANVPAYVALAGGGDPSFNYYTAASDDTRFVMPDEADIDEIILLDNGSSVCNVPGVAVTGGDNTITAKDADAVIMLIDGKATLTAGKGSAKGTMNVKYGNVSYVFENTSTTGSYEFDVKNDKLSVESDAVVVDANGVQYVGAGIFVLDENGAVAVDPDSTVKSKDGKDSITGVQDANYGTAVTTATDGSIKLTGGKGKSIDQMTAVINNSNKTFTAPSGNETYYIVDTAANTLNVPSNVTVTDETGAQFTDGVFTYKDDGIEVSVNGTVSSKSGGDDSTITGVENAKVLVTDGNAKLISGKGQSAGKMKALINNADKTFAAPSGNQIAYTVDTADNSLTAPSTVTVTDETGAQFTDGVFTYKDDGIEVSVNGTVSSKSGGDDSTITGVENAKVVVTGGNAKLSSGSGKSTRKLVATISESDMSFDGKGTEYTVNADGTLTLNANGSVELDGKATLTGDKENSFTIARSGDKTTVVVPEKASVTGNGVTITGVDKGNTGKATTVEIDPANGALTLIEGKGVIVGKATLNARFSFTEGEKVTVKTVSITVPENTTATVDLDDVPAAVKGLKDKESVTIDGVTYTAVEDSSFDLNGGKLAKEGEKVIIPGGLGRDVEMTIGEGKNEAVITVPKTNTGDVTVEFVDADTGTSRVTFTKTGDSFKYDNRSFTAGSNNALFTVLAETKTVSITSGSALLNRGDAVTGSSGQSFENPSNSGVDGVLVTANTPDDQKDTVTVPAGGKVKIGSTVYEAGSNGVTLVVDANGKVNVTAGALKSDEKIVKTGDESNMALWIIVMLGAGSALCAAVVLGKKKKD